MEHGPPATSTPPPTPLWRRVLAALVLIATMVAAGLVFYYRKADQWSQPGPDKPPAEDIATPPDGSPQP